MAGSRQLVLRVGVVGLGRLWEARHKPALLRLNDRFRVTAVYDQVQRRAEIEAAQLSCAAEEGLTALINRPDVDVIYLLNPQWFGLHAVSLACDAGKPVYCALPLFGEPAELSALADRIEAAGIPFMPEFARRFYPATLRLRELLATTLGAPRLIIGHTRLYGFDRYGTPGPTTQMAPAPLLLDPGGYLLDWCCFLFQMRPNRLQGWEGVVLPGVAGNSSADPDFESFTGEFDGGGIAQLSIGRYHRPTWGDSTRFLPPPGFQVYCERGAAWVELPDHVQWADSEGSHEERLPLEPAVGDVLNDQFHRLVRGDQSLAPDVRDALAVARFVEELRRSQAERGGEERTAGDAPG